ncbi:hypothetical protein [Bradyrhizobium sp. CIR3A]|uniref:hypothetical protein n=1 Tax=Bradyrhizobium sp. CIR3A TaxID=2663838 RepID=UPI0016057B42|nr:hypothetical protein [Bradyrhizobium sp. CIR3A]MBB4258065.1 hypothetical protein [Bradyrhizobium sp. CIR3A]
MPLEDGEWKEAAALVGELVLLYSALDHQLNLITIEVMHLAPSAMLESVVATLDPRQKIEMLKGRAAHIRQPDWKKALTTHADRLERIAKVRNAACHTPLISRPGGGFEFAATAASKLFKSLKVRSREDYTIDRLNLNRLREAIDLAEKALGSGEIIRTNFARIRSGDRAS